MNIKCTTPCLVSINDQFFKRKCSKQELYCFFVTTLVQQNSIGCQKVPYYTKHKVQMHDKLRKYEPLEHALASAACGAALVILMLLVFFMHLKHVLRCFMRPHTLRNVQLLKMIFLLL